jgi:hypothetical protein
MMRDLWEKDAEKGTMLGISSSNRITSASHALRAPTLRCAGIPAHCQGKSRLKPETLGSQNWPLFTEYLCR